MRGGSCSSTRSRRCAAARSAGCEATFAEPPPPDAFAGLPGVHELERLGRTVTFAVEGEIDPLVKALGRFRVLALESREADLEDVFLDLYRPEGHDAA